MVLDSERELGECGGVEEPEEPELELELESLSSSSSCQYVSSSIESFEAL